MIRVAHPDTSEFAIAAYRIKVSDPVRFACRPNFAWILPGEEAMVHVETPAQDVKPGDSLNGKIMVETWLMTASELATFIALDPSRAPKRLQSVETRQVPNCSPAILFSTPLSVSPPNKSSCILSCFQQSQPQSSEYVSVLRRQTSILRRKDGLSIIQSSPLGSESKEQDDLADYDSGPIVGKGAFGIVRLYKRKPTSITPEGEDNFSNCEEIALKEVPLTSPESWKNAVKEVLALRLCYDNRPVSLLKLPDSKSNHFGHNHFIPHVFFLHRALPSMDSPLHRALMAMEYAPGGSLAQLASAFARKNESEYPEKFSQLTHDKKKQYKRGIPVGLVRLYLFQVVRALVHVHACAVTHRDIKGANILLGPQQKVLIGDFGSSRIDYGDDSVSQGTSSHSVIQNRVASILEELGVSDISPLELLSKEESVDDEKSMKHDSEVPESATMSAAGTGSAFESTSGFSNLPFKNGSDTVDDKSADDGDGLRLPNEQGTLQWMAPEVILSGLSMNSKGNKIRTRFPENSKLDFSNLSKRDLKRKTSSQLLDLIIQKEIDATVNSGDNRGASGQGTTKRTFLSLLGFGKKGKNSNSASLPKESGGSSTSSEIKTQTAISAAQLWWEKTDIWSIGCTTLELLTALPPWGDVGQDSANVMLHIVSADLRDKIPSWIHGELRDFIVQCLNPDASERPSALQLLQHPFLATGSSFNSDDLREDIDESMFLLDNEALDSLVDPVDLTALAAEIIAEGELDDTFEGNDDFGDNEFEDEYEEEDAFSKGTLSASERLLVKEDHSVGNTPTVLNSPVRQFNFIENQQNPEMFVNHSRESIDVTGVDGHSAIHKKDRVFDIEKEMEEDDEDVFSTLRSDLTANHPLNNIIKDLSDSTVKGGDVFSSANTESVLKNVLRAMDLPENSSLKMVNSSEGQVSSEYTDIIESSTHTDRILLSEANVNKISQSLDKKSYILKNGTLPPPLSTALRARVNLKSLIALLKVYCKKYSSVIRNSSVFSSSSDSSLSNESEVVEPDVIEGLLCRLHPRDKEEAAAVVYETTGLLSDSLRLRLSQKAFLTCTPLDHGNMLPRVIFGDAVGAGAAVLNEMLFLSVGAEELEKNPFDVDSSITPIEKVGIRETHGAGGGLVTSLTLVLLRRINFWASVGMEVVLDDDNFYRCFSFLKILDDLETIPASDWGGGNSCVEDDANINEMILKYNYMPWIHENERFYGFKNVLESDNFDWNINELFWWKDTSGEQNSRNGGIDINIEDDSFGEKKIKIRRFVHEHLSDFMESFARLHCWSLELLTCLETSIALRLYWKSYYLVKYGNDADNFENSTREVVPEMQFQIEQAIYSRLIWLYRTWLHLRSIMDIYNS